MVVLVKRLLEHRRWLGDLQCSSCRVLSVDFGLRWIDYDRVGCFMDIRISPVRHELARRSKLTANHQIWCVSIICFY